MNYYPKSIPRVQVYALAKCFIILFFAAIKLSAQTVTYQKGSTVKIEQLIGDYDKERKTATNNLTNKKYKLLKTDLGVPFSHNGKTFVLFGDVPASANKDPMAYSTDTNPADGFSLSFITGTTNKWAPIIIPGIKTAAYEVPTEGVSWNNTMYIYFATDYKASAGFSTRNIIAKSLDDGKTFTYMYDVSTGKFINISVVKSKTGNGFPETEGRDVQLMFGSGTYRKSNVYLAYQLADSIGKKSMKYFKGMNNGIPQWSTSETDAVALFNQPQVGELSVSYNSFIKKWIMLYNAGTPRGINCRVADNPWGPWEAPLVIFDPWVDGGYCHFMHVDWNFTKCDSVYDTNKQYVWGGEYGPYQFEDFATGDSTQTTIYYTMSTWNPYTSILMKSTLRKVNGALYSMDNKEGEKKSNVSIRLSQQYEEVEQ